MYIKSSSDSNEVIKYIHDWIDSEVKNSGDYGFIDKDFFISCYDGQFTAGYFSKLIDFVNNYIEENPDDSLDDATEAALEQASYTGFDEDNCLSVLDLSDDAYEIIALFRQHMNI